MTAATVKRYRKLPVVVEAVLWDGTNEAAIVEWTGGHFHTVTPGTVRDPDITASVFDKLHSTWIGVKTGQYVIKGTLGEFYPHDASNFPTSYEPADDDLDLPGPTTILDVCALASLRSEYPTFAVQYAVRMPSGYIQVYGDQHWIAGGNVIRDVHADGVIVRRPVHITYGDWAEMPTPKEA